MSPPTVSQPGHLSWGFLAPTAHKGGGIHGLPAYRSGTPVFRDYANSSHAASYGATPRLSQPLSGLFFPLPSCHFQAGSTPGVLPFRDLCLPRSSNGSSPPDCPLDVCPAGCAPLVLGERSHRRACHILGSTDKHPWPSSGPLSTRESACITGSWLCTDDRPSPPGLQPPHGSNNRREAGLPLCYRHASQTPSPSPD